MSGRISSRKSLLDSGRLYAAALSTDAARTSSLRAAIAKSEELLR